MSINGINNMGSYNRAMMEAANAARTKDTAGAPRAGAAPAAQATGDRINVSTDAVLRTEAYKVASASTDVRQEKVNAIKERIASGNYQIDNRRIASKLVQSEVALFRK